MSKKLDQTSGDLTEFLFRRMLRAGLEESFAHASEIVVFGSRATNLETHASDIDVLLVLPSELTHKDSWIDVIGLTPRIRNSQEWMNDEIASHIREYGVWLRGSPNWTENNQISQSAIDRKVARIKKYLRSLPHSWLKLDEVYRNKYALKLRRETQRLIFLESQRGVPPTRLLDENWPSIFGSEEAVYERLLSLGPCESGSFLNDLQLRMRKRISPRPRFAALTAGSRTENL